MKLGLSAGPLAVKPGSSHGARASLWEPITYGDMPCSALMEGGVLSPDKFNVPDFVDPPHGSPYTLEGVDGVSWGKVRR